MKVKNCFLHATATERVQKFGFCEGSDAGKAARKQTEKVCGSEQRQD